MRTLLAGHKMSLAVDLAEIRNALNHSRNHAHDHRYGGLGRMHKEMISALEALDRIEAILQPPKPVKAGARAGTGSTRSLRAVTGGSRDRDIRDP